MSIRGNEGGLLPVSIGESPKLSLIFYFKPQPSTTLTITWCIKLVLFGKKLYRIPEMRSPG
jgi:hypothetical protein